MRRKYRRIIIIVLFSFLLSLWLVEIYLWHGDPYGMRIYMTDLGALRDVRTSHATGTQYYVGRHELESYGFTALPDGLRLVPDTGSSDCVIAAVGDSLTFGMGVEDHETWVNLLARQYPDARFVNAGRPGYAIGNVLRSIEYYDADGYIYYVVNNDDDPPLTHEHDAGTSRQRRAIEYYLYYLSITSSNGGGSSVGHDYPLDKHLMDLVQLPQVLVVANAGDNTLSTANVRTNGWSPTISRADPHPNAEGHRNVAAFIAEYVGALIENVCDEPTSK